MKNKTKHNQKRKEAVKSILPVLGICLISACIGGVIVIMAHPTLQEISVKKGQCKLSYNTHNNPCVVKIVVEPKSIDIQLW